MDPLVSVTRDAVGYGNNNPIRYADPTGLYSADSLEHHIDAGDPFTYDTPSVRTKTGRRVVARSSICGNDANMPRSFRPMRVAVAMLATLTMFVGAGCGSSVTRAELSALSIGSKGELSCFVPDRPATRPNRAACYSFGADSPPVPVLEIGDCVVVELPLLYKEPEATAKFVSVEGTDCDAISAAEVACWTEELITKRKPTKGCTER